MPFGITEHATSYELPRPCYTPSIRSDDLMHSRELTSTSSFVAIANENNTPPSDILCSHLKTPTGPFVDDIMGRQCIGESRRGGLAFTYDVLRAQRHIISSSLPGLQVSTSL